LSTFISKRGRPQKFNRPARQITLTLPDDVIQRLDEVDEDLGRAVVRLAMAARPAAETRGVELATFGSRAVIVVSPSKVLAGLRGVELVPLADGRALIALDEGSTESHFELGIRDLLDGQAISEADRTVLTTLSRLLHEARRDASLTLRRIMVLRSNRARTIPGVHRTKTLPRLKR
jgi:hypothetical protein